MISSLNILAKLSGQKCILPFYHAVSNRVKPHLKHLYNVRSCEQFEHDLQFFLKHYKPIAISNLVKQPNSQKCFSLTFDDGLREFKDFAWPILKKYNVPVTLFVNTAFVDNAAMFYRFKASLLIEQVNLFNEIDWKKINVILKKDISTKELLVKALFSIKYDQKHLLDHLAPVLGVDFTEYLKNEQPYLTINELKELQREGVLIGAHSVDHPMFNNLLLDEQILQTSESIQWVQQHLQPELNTFSFPFTDFGVKATFFKAVYNNPKLNVTATFGTAGMKREHFTKHYQRIPMEDTTKTACCIIYGQYRYFLAKTFLFKNTIRR